MASSAVSLFVLALDLVSFALASSWIQYPPDGLATMTHYDLPRDYIAACACNGPSTHYPTAALSQMAFGSSTAYGWSPRSANNCNDLTMHKPGPACGRCFNLTLLNTFLSVPPFFPPTPKSVVVKVTDLCPLSTTGWCNATQEGPNMSVLPLLHFANLLIFSQGRTLCKTCCTQCQIDGTQFTLSS